MIDIESKIRALLVKLPDVTAAFGARIYAAHSLPPGYDVSTGPALLFTIRGGSQRYHSQAYDASIQCRVYAATEAAARQASGLLYDAVNDTQARSFAWMRLEDGTLPVLLNEPAAGWPYMLSFYRFQVQNL